MSTREQRRAQVLSRALAGTWTRAQAQAAATLGRSERQLRRLLRAYQVRGPAGVVHGNRGRRPAHALPATQRERVLELARVGASWRARRMPGATMSISPSDWWSGNRGSPSVVRRSNGGDAGRKRAGSA